MNLNRGNTGHIFKEYLKNKGFSSKTVYLYLRDINCFFSRMKELVNKDDLRDVKSQDIMKYMSYLKNTKIKNGSKYSYATISRRLITVRNLFKFLLRNEYIIYNPFDRLDISMFNRKKMRMSVSRESMNNFLDMITCRDYFDIRDRTILELMYGTGIRVSEASKLTLKDIDLHEGRLLVREGKWKKDRIVPLGNNVIRWLKIYLRRSRKHLLKKVKNVDDRERVFLSNKGKGFSTNGIQQMIRKRRKETDPKLKLTAHIIRHSFATHILENGAGIKQVKEILGHKRLDTTVCYTHFNVSSLKRIMKQYHPRENELYDEVKRSEYIRVLEG